MQVTQKYWIRTEESVDWYGEPDGNGDRPVKTIFSLVNYPVSDWTFVDRENPTEITYEIPEDYDPVAQAIESLRLQERNLQADFQLALTAIQSRLNKYLSIAGPKTSNGMDILMGADYDGKF